MVTQCSRTSESGNLADHEPSFGTVPDGAASHWPRGAEEATAGVQPEADPHAQRPALPAHSSGVAFFF
jgi:hypothetical protein